MVQLTALHNKFAYKDRKSVGWVSRLRIEFGRKIRPKETNR